MCWPSSRSSLLKLSAVAGLIDWAQGGELLRLSYYLYPFLLDSRVGSCVAACFGLAGSIRTRAPSRAHPRQRAPALGRQLLGPQLLEAQHTGHACRRSRLFVALACGCAMVVPLAIICRAHSLLFILLLLGASELLPALG